MDSKKKGNIGEFFQKGEGYCTEAPAVFDHSFPLPELGTMVPHGRDSVERNEGYLTAAA